MTATHPRSIEGPRMPARQVSRSTRARYGTSTITAVAWEGEDSTSIELHHTGLTASVQLTRAQLAEHRDKITELLAETEPSA